MKLNRRQTLNMFLASALAGAGFAAAAQDAWKPNKPIRLVVPFPPGGGADVLGRLTAPGVGTRLSQTVFIENKGGASGAIGSEFVYRSPPDGYSLLLTTVDTQVINPQIAKVNFDSSKFVPLGAIAEAPYVLVGRPDLPAANLAELLALMKTRQLSYASAGNGTVTHVLSILFGREAKGQPLIHAPYQGSGPAAQAVLSGTVDLCWIAPSTANQNRARLRVFATPSRERLELLKDVPTMMEQGLAVTGASWLGWIAPPDIPEPIAASLSKAIRDTVSSPEVLDKIRGMGMIPLQMSQAEFTRFYQDEYRKWGDLIRSANVKVE